MATNLSEYISFLEKYRDELSEVLKNEREKRQSLLNSDMDKLESVLALQQAETMKLRSFESKRIEFQAKLGMKDATAGEIVSSITDIELRNRLDGLFSEILGLAEEVREQNRLSSEIASTNLKILNKIFRSNEISEQKNTYGPDNGHRAKYSAGATFKESV
ncbi:MAG: flagellar export chaperone FlgN [Oscillospiraceae bacterium]